MKTATGTCSRFGSRFTRRHVALQARAVLLTRERPGTARSLPLFCITGGSKREERQGPSSAPEHRGNTAITHCTKQREGPKQQQFPHHRTCRSHSARCSPALIPGNSQAQWPHAAARVGKEKQVSRARTQPLSLPRGARRLPQRRCRPARQQLPGVPPGHNPALWHRCAPSCRTAAETRPGARTRELFAAPRLLAPAALVPRPRFYSPAHLQPAAHCNNRFFSF